MRQGDTPRLPAYVIFLPIDIKRGNRGIEWNEGGRVWARLISEQRSPYVSRTHTPGCCYKCDVSDGDL
eukprot:1353119-Amorphochlora_amoeboformis.AAC.1